MLHFGFKMVIFHQKVKRLHPPEQQLNGQTHFLDIHIQYIWHYLKYQSISSHLPVLQCRPRINMSTCNLSLALPQHQIHSQNPIKGHVFKCYCVFVLYLKQVQVFLHQLSELTTFRDKWIYKSLLTYLKRLKCTVLEHCVEFLREHCVEFLRDVSFRVSSAHIAGVCASSQHARLSVHTGRHRELDGPGSLSLSTSLSYFSCLSSTQSGC